MSATKDQEREALKKIREIVDGLGVNSYIGMAFEGCFELAEENIENDFGRSLFQRWEGAESEAYELREKVVTLEEMVNKRDSKIGDLEDEIRQLKIVSDGLRQQINKEAESVRKSWNDFMSQRDRADKAEAEIIKLKAKLYDLLIKN